MEIKKLEQKFTDEAMDQIMANNIGPDLKCEVHIETEPKPQKGEKVKALLYYGDRKRPVGTDIVKEGGHAFFRDITVKQCGEYPEKKKFRVKFETISKPEEPKGDADNGDTKTDVPDKPSDDVTKIEREKREREERKKARREERKRQREERERQKKLAKAGDPAAVHTAPSTVSPKRHFSLRSKGPDGARGTRVVYLIWEGTLEDPSPVANDALIFGDIADRVETVPANQQGRVEYTLPFAWTREVPVSLASRPDESTFITVN